MYSIDGDNIHEEVAGTERNDKQLKDLNHDPANP